MGTWDTSTGKMPQSYDLLNYDGTQRGPHLDNYAVESAYGIFAEAGFYPQYVNTYAGTQWLGCLAYVLPGQRAKFTGAFFASRLNGLTLRGCHSSVTGGSPAALLACNDRQADRGIGLSAKRFAHYGGSCRIDPEWDPTGIVARMPLPRTQWKLPYEGDANGDGNVDVGDLGVLSANWDRKLRFVGSYELGDFNRDGNVDTGDLGIVSANFSNAAPLWPWPMEDRIAQAMVRGGYPAISVTKQVEEAFGETPMSSQQVLPSAQYRYYVNVNTEDWPGARTSWARWNTWQVLGGTPNAAQFIHDAENDELNWSRAAMRFNLAGLGGTVLSAKLVTDAVSGGTAHVYAANFANITDITSMLAIIPNGTHMGPLVADGGVKSVDVTAKVQAALGGNCDFGVVEGTYDQQGTTPNWEDEPNLTVSWTNDADSPRLEIIFADPPPAGPPVGTMSLLGVGR